jgi:hypothetical protein
MSENLKRNSYSSVHVVLVRSVRLLLYLRDAEGDKEGKKRCDMGTTLTLKTYCGMLTSLV